MALTDDLTTILRREHLKCPRDGSVELREKYRGRPDMRVQVVGVSVPVAQVRVEKVGHLPGLQEGVRGLRQICDYALLAEANGEIHAVLIELKPSRNNDDEPREQLRRSLPVLEYLRSACDVERGTGMTRKMSVGYVLIFQRENPVALDKQTVRTEALTTEQYRNIAVSTFVGTTIPFPWLMATLPSA